MAPTSPSGAPLLIPLLPRELQRAGEHEPQTASREIKERNSPGFIGSSGRNTGFCHLPNPQCGRVWAPWSHLKLCSAPQKLWGCNREEMRQRMGKNVLCGLRGRGRAPGSVNNKDTATAMAGPPTEPHCVEHSTRIPSLRSPQRPRVAGTTPEHILHMQKLRLQEGKCLAGSYKARKWPDPKPIPFVQCPRPRDEKNSRGYQGQAQMSQSLPGKRRKLPFPQDNTLLPGARTQPAFVGCQHWAAFQATPMCLRTSWKTNHRKKHWKPKKKAFGMYLFIHWKLCL